MTSVNNRLAAIETIVGAELPVIRQILQEAGGSNANPVPAGATWPTSPAEGDTFLNLTTGKIGIWRGATNNWYDANRYDATVWQPTNLGQPFVDANETEKLAGYIHKPLANAYLEAIQVGVYMNVARSGQLTFRLYINENPGSGFVYSVENIIIPLSNSNQWLFFGLVPGVRWGEGPIRVNIFSDNETGDDRITFLLSAQYRPAIG